MKTKSLQNKATKAERKKYLLSTQRDLEILAKCKQLEKMRLNASDINSWLNSSKPSLSATGESRF